MFYSFSVITRLFFEREKRKHRRVVVESCGMNELSTSEKEVCKENFVVLLMDSNDEAIAAKLRIRDSYSVDLPPLERKAASEELAHIQNDFCWWEFLHERRILQKEYRSSIPLVQENQ